MRAYAGILRDGRVLMVRHVHGGRDYWTLPGGSVEPGESVVEAACREVWEETGVVAEGLGELFRDERGVCLWGSCADGAVAVVGVDPELGVSEQVIREVGWFELASVSEDWQVAEVLARLPGLRGA